MAILNTVIVYDVAGLLKTASGSVIAVSDALAKAVKSLDVDINAVQNLNGYDHPWPAGGGKNKIGLSRTEGTPTPADLLVTPRLMDTGKYYAGLRSDNYYYPNYVTSFSVTDTTVKVTSANNTRYGVAFPVACAASSQYTISATLTEAQISVGAYDASWNFLSQVIGPNSEPPLIITTPADAAYITIIISSRTLGVEGTATNIQLELGSTATTYAPYSNICPIIGCSNVKVTRTGKNLLDDSIKTVNGGRLLIGATTLYESPTYLKAGTTYSITVFGINATFGYLMKNQYALKTIVNGTNHGSFTVDNDGYYRIDLYGNAATSGDVTGVILVPGSTYATAYEPYNGNTYTIQLGQTVYGGSLDVTTGVLTVDMATIDLGSLTWTYYTVQQIPMFYADISGGKAYPTGTSVKSYCSDYKVESNSMSASNFAGLGYFHAAFNGASTSRVLISDSRYTDKDTFKTAMSGVQLVYELATPQTIQLSPTTVRMLVGNNTLCANSGDSELVYWASQA